MASVGTTEASTSTPGAEMSGFRTSPPPASEGPREENAMTSGTWVSLPSATPARIAAVASGLPPT